MRYSDGACGRTPSGVTPRDVKEGPVRQPMAIRVLIVEDQALFRDMLRLSLASHKGMQVVGMAGDAAGAVALARKQRPDVVLMDIDLGGGPTGIDAGRLIKQESPAVGIVLLSMHKDKEYLAAISPDRAAGWSYLLKQSVADVGALTRAIEGAAAGLVVLDPGLVTGLIPRPNSDLGALTRRQIQVLELIAQGYSNSAIAAHLRVEEKSVENYINAIYQLLGVHRDERAHPRVRAVLAYLEQSRQSEKVSR